MDQFLDTENSPTSLTLLGRAKNNDQVAWEKIVHIYGPIVMRWCVRQHIRDQQTCEEITFDVFTAFYKQQTSFVYQGRGSFRGYLKSITHNKCVDFFRAKERDQFEHCSDSQLQQIPVPEVIDESMNDREDEMLVIRRIYELLDDVSEQMREAFLLRVYDQLSYQEIAERQMRSEDAVKMGVKRVRDKIRDGFLDLI